MLFLVSIAGLYLKLASGPINLGSHSEKVESSLAARLGPDWSVSVQDTTIELLGLKPAIRIGGLEIRNPSGITVVRAPLAVVILNPASLLIGQFSPRDIELRDLHLRGRIARDGSLSFATQVDTPVPHPAEPLAGEAGAAPAAAADDAKGPSVVSAAAESLLRPLISPSGVIGGLDRATIVDASLTLLGSDGRERVAFDGVDALFEKAQHSDRRFEIELRGQRGSWRVAGRVSGAKGHATSIEAESIPISDLMLLGGLSKLPATSDVKVSGTLTALFTRDRLALVQGRLWGSAGSIERVGAPPIRIDDASADIAWDEAARALALTSLKMGSEGTRVDLQGKLADENGAWRFALGGRDLVVADREPTRSPFKLAMFDVGGRIEDGNARLDHLTARGEGVDISLSGSFTPGRADEVFTSRLEANETDARKLVRLWPNFINPGLRSYLAERLSGGMVHSLRLKSVFNADDFKAAFNDDPFRDEAIEVTFSGTDVSLGVIDGLPPLTKLSVEGRTTGRTVSMTALNGAVAMPDGRSVTFTDASFLHPSLDKKGSAAQIGFRVRGGFDAFASLLQSPLLREAGIPVLDPANVRGNVDLKATLPLVPGSIPPFSQLGMELVGTLSDVSADKLPARERLEGGQFTVVQDAAGFGIKGEGKLGGSPSTFELRVPKSGSGELTINTVLDDAARTRRSLPSSPALSGPVGVKLSLPLKGKLVPRLEADLSRASIEGLLPGWQKAANRAGRIQFTLSEGSGMELNDIVVDSGTVQMKGNASLSSAGGLERADLSSFRMSTGDDMRAQIERAGSGYRITVRGNNADARPLLKWLKASTGKGGAKDSPDLDLDLNVAILSGFNDEAMTSVAAKASMRGGELRNLQFGGKFRNAAIEANVAKKDAGAPVLSFRSWDAGATLRFLDAYRRMVGGRLGLEARLGDAVHEGQVTIDDFILRGEPALRRIVAQTEQQAGSGSDDQRGQAPARQDADQVQFNRMTTGFRKTGSRTEYTDAVIYGPQVGFNLSGWVDSTRDRIDVTGTFVPAFMLNNAFSQLPVIGMILGGGRTEGLIAVEFRVAGALSGPNVTVNPLTAVAPGILRKLFGWVTPEGKVDPTATTSAENGVPPIRRRTR